jgi:hypothetical protein
MIRSGVMLIVISRYYGGECGLSLAAGCGTNYSIVYKSGYELYATNQRASAAPRYYFFLFGFLRFFK